LASYAALNEGMGKEAVDLGLRAAELLNVPVRRDPDGLAAGIRADRAVVDAIAGTDLVRHLETLPTSANQRMTTAIGLLLALEPAVFMNQQIGLYNLIGLRVMALTLRFGADQYTPGVIAIYAMLDRGESTRRAKTFALTTLARRLARRTNPALMAYTGCLYSTFVHHWMRPITGNLPSMVRDARAGFDHGDVMLGCFNTASHVVLLARAGAPLRAVVAAARRAAALIDGRASASAFHCKLEIQIAQALAGRTAQPWSLTDLPGHAVSDVDVVEERDIAAITETDLFNQIAYYLSAKARLQVYYRRFGEAVDHALRAEPLQPAFAGQVEEPEFTMWFALGLIGRRHEGDAAKAAALLARLQNWAHDAPDLLGHKALLVEGRLAATSGQAPRAHRLLLAAAESASRAGFRQHAAFAWELAGRHVSTTGERTQALHHLHQAASGYEKLGAHAKVIDVQRAMDELR
jgi:hypothetical protein